MLFFTENLIAKSRKIDTEVAESSTMFASITQSDDEGDSVKLSVDLPSQSYPVIIERGGLEALGPRVVEVLGEVPRVVVITPPRLVV